MDNNTKQITLLTSPLNKIQAAAEKTLEIITKISEVILSGANGKSSQETSSELKKQTTILTDIRSILREQNKTLTTGVAAKGGPGGGMFKPMSAKDVGLTALMIVGVAGAIVGAAAIFSLVPVITIPQLLTVLAIAGIFALIVPTFVKITETLSKNSKDIAGENGKNTNLSNLKSMLAVAGITTLAMVSIAISIVLSGAIFFLMPLINPMQLLTALAISIIMIPLSYAYSIILKEIKNLNHKQLIFAALAIPLIALGIVGVAFIFQKLPVTNEEMAPDPKWVLKSALAIGLYTVGFYFIMKAIKGAKPIELIFGAIAIPLIALGIVGVAFIFQKLLVTDEKMAPDPKWVLKSALAIGLFTVGFYFIMKAIKGAKPKELIFGAIAIPLIALGILGVAKIFESTPATDEEMAPHPIWVLRSALAIGLFAVGFYIIMKAIKGVKPKELIFGAIAIPLIALSILGVAKIFEITPATDEEMAPHPIWVLKSALAIGLFAVGFYIIMKAIKGAKPKELIFGAIAIPLIALSILGVAKIFEITPATDEEMAPHPIWVLKSALAIGLFAVGFYFIMKAIKGVDLKGLIFGALAIPILASGILATAFIFLGLSAISEYLAPTPKWVLEAGFALLIFAIPFFIVSKAIKGMSIKQLLFMTVALPVVAFVVLATAWIFQMLPDVYKSPEPTWTLKAGLAIVIFGAALWLSSKTLGKLGIGNLIKGLIGVVVAAFAIIAVGWILQLSPSKWVAPPWDWTLQTGLALGVMGVAIAAMGLAVMALTPATLLLGALGIIVAAITILAVGWILSALEPAIPKLVTVAEGFTKILLAPINGIVDIFARFKNEIGIENMIGLAVGIAALGGAWLILTAALAGGSVAGMLGAAAEIGTAIFTGIGKLFGGEGKLSPIDILQKLAAIQPELQTLAKPIMDVGKGFAKINTTSAGVMKAFASLTDLHENIDLNDFSEQEISFSGIASSYIKIAAASKVMNVKAIDATTNMFKALDDLAKNGGESAMAVLADKLMDAVEKLSKTVVNLEQSIDKQGSATTGIGNAISGAINAVKDTVTGVKENVDKMNADTKEAAIDLQPLINAIQELEARFDRVIRVNVVETV